MSSNNNPISIKNIIIDYTPELNDISTTPRLDIEVIIAEILGYENKIDLMMNYERILTETELSSFHKYFNMRKNHMPIAYIFKKKEFMGYEFYVDENVLIPRPDTEIIVEGLIELISEYIAIDNNTSKLNHFEGKDYKINILDMCTGSGAIALSTSKYLKEEKDISDNLNFYGVDISRKALNICLHNSKKLGVNNIKLIESNLFSSENLLSLKGKLDFIVSNPPYIEDSIIPTLSSDVKEFEPIIALSGGEDGMDFYNKIIEESVYFLKDKGILIFEAGHNQAEKIREKMLEYGYENIFFKQDLQGFNRMVVGTFSTRLNIKK